MRNFAQVEDVAHKVRDMDSGAILSTDLASLESYKAGRLSRQQAASDINTLKTEMSEIKAMLHMLLEKESK